MTKASYRKRPVTIEAIQLTEHNVQEVAEFMDVGHSEHDYTEDYHGTGKPAVYVQTLEGLRVGEVGDYIIKDVKGEYYTCKPDSFQMTYEATTPFEGALVAHLTLGELARVRDEALGMQEASWDEGKGGYGVLLEQALVRKINELHPKYESAQVVEIASMIKFMGSALDAYIHPSCARHNPDSPVMIQSGVAAISFERHRQQHVHGYTLLRDVEHNTPEALALAAACYAIPPEYRAPDQIDVMWPWGQDYWNPGDRRRDLAKAGALCAAAMDLISALEAQAVADGEDEGVEHAPGMGL